MFVFSSHTRPAHSETSTAALTTPALNRRSLRWFGISACTATPEDLPPSLAQHGSCRRSSTSSSLPFRTHEGARNPVGAGQAACLYSLMDHRSGSFGRVEGATGGRRRLCEIAYSQVSECRTGLYRKRYRQNRTSGRRGRRNSDGFRPLWNAARAACEHSGQAGDSRVVSPDLDPVARAWPAGRIRPPAMRFGGSGDLIENAAARRVGEACGVAQLGRRRMLVEPFCRRARRRRRGIGCAAWNSARSEAIAASYPSGSASHMACSSSSSSQ